MWACTEISRNSREGKVTVLWSQQVQTFRTIPNNQPDMIIRDNEKRNMYVALYCIVLYCIVVGSRRLMPPDVLQPKAYCTNPGL